MHQVHNVFHVSLIKPYRSDGRTQPPPPPDLVDDCPEWTVEQVLDHRVVKRGRQRNVEYTPVTMRLLVVFPTHVFCLQLDGHDTLSDLKEQLGLDAKHFYFFWKAKRLGRMQDKCALNACQITSGSKVRAGGHHTDCWADDAAIRGKERFIFGLP